MNNSLNVLKYLKRAGLERRVIAACNRSNPNVEQYIASNRYPVIPKIVIYSASASSDSFLNNIFPFFGIISPGLTAETDEALALRIANELTRHEETEGDENARFGFLLKGFPFNTTQALLLDRYINGVNLALHVRTTNESPDFLESIKPLLTYYDERGTLLELTHSAEPTVEEIGNAIEDVRIKIKRSC